MKTPTCIFEVFTPEAASAVIANQNNGNRRVRRWWVEALAQSMKRGKFITTHQGVAFTSSGRLIDGQHRLMAIIASEIPQTLLVVRNLPEEAFSYIDIGVKRSTPDVTGLSQKTSEVCRLALRIKTNRTSAMPDQVMEVANAGLKEVHDELWSYSTATCELLSTAPVRLAACLLVMDGHDSKDVFATYADMVTFNYSALPPSTLSFMKQKEQKKMNSGVVGDVFARALKALDPDMKSVSRIQVDEDGIRSAYDRARLIINRSIGAKT